MKLYIVLVIVAFLHLLNNKFKYSVLLFTLYFPVKHHKHSIEQYINWSKLFINMTKSKVIFFTDNKLKNTFPHLNNVIFFYFDSIVNIPIIKKLEIKKKVKKDVYQIYHSKVALLYYVSNRFPASIYFFNNISTFHYKPFENIKNYPNIYFIKKTFKNINYPTLFTIDSNKSSKQYIQVGCIGGNRKAIRYLFNNYYTFLDNYYFSLTTT